METPSDQPTVNIVPPAEPKPPSIKLYILGAALLIVIGVGVFFFFKSQTDNKTPDEMPETSSDIATPILSPILSVDGHATDYATLSQNVYCKEQILPNADPESFEVLLTYWSITSSEWGVEYAKDKSHVYSGCIIVPQVDATTFKIVANSGVCAYTKDKDNAYYGCHSDLTAIANADPGSFESIGGFGNYARDKQSVYFDGKIISEADPKTFVRLKDQKGQVSFYARDSKNVYSDGDIFPLADSATFEVLLVSQAGGLYYTGAYAKDKNHVYDLNGEILQGVDPATFVSPKE